MALITRRDLSRKMLDDLAVAQEQNVVFSRHDSTNLGKEGPHMLVAVTLAGRMVRGRRTSRRTVSTWDERLDLLAEADSLGAQAQDRRRRRRDPDAGGSRRCHRTRSTPPAARQNDINCFMGSVLLPA